MNIQRGVGRHRIDGWEFSPATGELRRRTDVRRLEPRASRALELLCEADGDVVSQEQLIAGVWNGRALSENSVAVVIGQLRRALDDDAREPRLIETIPKRGYRLRREAMAAAARPGEQGRLLLIALLLVLLGALAVYVMRGRPVTAVVVSDVANETGNPKYEPLARATSELIVTEIGNRDFAIRRSGAGSLVLGAKLIMWDGMPFLSMTATDSAGVVRWSAMINASPGRVPPGVDQALDDFSSKFNAKAGAAPLANGQAAR